MSDQPPPPNTPDAGGAAEVTDHSGGGRVAPGTHALRGQEGDRRAGPDDRADARGGARPAATACSRAYRAWRRPWPSRPSRPWSAARFARIQFTPDLVPADIMGTRIYRTVEREVRRRARPGVRELPARRRDQPGAGQGAVGAARGDGRAAGLHRRHDLRGAATRSWSWPPRTRSSRRASTRCPRRSGTGSCSRSWWATRPTSRSGRSSTGSACASRRRRRCSTRRS